MNTQLKCPALPGELLKDKNKMIFVAEKNRFF